MPLTPLEIYSQHAIVRSSIPALRYVTSKLVLQGRRMPLAARFSGSR